MLLYELVLVFIIACLPRDVVVVVVVFDDGKSTVPIRIWRMNATESRDLGYT